MESNPERRNKTRFEHECKITLENSEIGVLRNCAMYNFNNRGLYIEADTQLEPGTKLRIGIKNSPFAAEPDQFESYHGLIKWRKELKRSSYYFGYGVELVKDRTFEGTTENVSSDGISVKAKNPVMVGQQITVQIPLKKKGKIARLQGKVSWTNRDGFGVKFLRSK